MANKDVQSGMNIEELARQAGIDLESNQSFSREPVWIATQQELEAFAELVLEQAAKNFDDKVRAHIGKSVMSIYGTSAECKAARDALQRLLDDNG